MKHSSGFCKLSCIELMFCFIIKQAWKLKKKCESASKLKLSSKVSILFGIKEE